MKIISIVGARPQFIKLSVVSREIRKQHEEAIIHTGQHYDPNMSEKFFEEMDISYPDINLEIGSMPHASQTAAMMQAIEEKLFGINADLVIVYGDTNTTLAGGLVASKMHIPVAHVEAGLRSYNKLMPEELNRVITDHLSSILFCPSQNAVENLRKENITRNVFNVGDVMLDSLGYYKKKTNAKILEKYRLREKQYCLATIHRAENTDNLNKLKVILEAFEDSKETIVFPIHPRTYKLIVKNACPLGKNIKLIEPVGYLDMLCLEKYSKKIITDSGGVQKEAYYFNIPCLTIREETEWIETIKCKANKLLRINKEEIVEAIRKKNKEQLFKDNFYGTGSAASKILAIINRYLKNKVAD